MKVTSIDLSIIQTVIETPEERIIQHWGTGKMGGKLLMQSSQKLQPKAQAGQPAPTAAPKLKVAEPAKAPAAEPVAMPAPDPALAQTPAAEPAPEPAPE